MIIILQANTLCNEQKRRTVHSRETVTKYETNTAGLQRWEPWPWQVRSLQQHTYPLLKLWGRVLAVLVSALLTTTGVLPHTGVFFMLWYQVLTLVYVLVSGPLHFHHKVFFITTRWWTFASLLNVGGNCKTIELVPFLLANIFACLEPDL